MFEFSCALYYVASDFSIERIQPPPPPPALFPLWTGGGNAEICFVAGHNTFTYLSLYFVQVLVYTFCLWGYF